MTNSRPRGGAGLGRQFSWIAAGRALSAVLQAVSLVLVVRQVSPGEFGVLAAALGVVTVLQSGFDFGLPTLAARERAVGAEAIVWKALRLNSITSLLLLIGLGVAGLLLALSDALYWMLLPLALAGAFERVSDARLGVAVADGDAWKNFIGVVGRRLVSVITFATLTLVSNLDPLLSFALGSALGAVLSAAFAVRSVKAQRPIGVAPAGRQVLLRARHFWLNSFALQLRNLDATLAVLVGGAVQGGLYGLASRLAVPLRLPASSMGAALLPAAAKSAEGGNRSNLRKTALRAWLLFSAAYVTAVPLTPLLVPWIAGVEFNAAVPVVQISLIGLCFAAFCSLFAPLLQGWGAQKLVARSSMLATAICLICVIVFTFWWGAVGAALAFSVSFMVQALVIAGFVIAGARGERGLLRD